MYYVDVAHMYKDFPVQVQSEDYYICTGRATRSAARVDTQGEGAALSAE